MFLPETRLKLIYLTTFNICDNHVGHFLHSSTVSTFSSACDGVKSSSGDGHFHNSMHATMIQPVAIIKSFQVWPGWNPFQASYACHRFPNYCNINTFEPVTINEIWTSKSPNMVYSFTTLINPARVSEWCIQHLETLSSIRWIRTSQHEGNCELWAVTTKRRRQVSDTKRHVSFE